MNKLFSPLQICIAAGIGGPLAAAYMFQENFIAMGDEASAQKSKIIGLCLAIFIAVGISYLPPNWPGYLSSLIYVAVSLFVISKSQYKNDEIRDSALYSFQSNWQVLGVTIVGLILFAILLFATAYTMAKIGLA